MNEKDTRGQRNEFLVMVSLGLPGLGLFLAGLKLIGRFGHPLFPGMPVMALGACLLLATGYYHYRKDYRSMGVKKGIAAFVAITFVSAVLGMLASGTLVRWITGR